VLRHIEEVNQAFYLSGGTALSRQYLQHRFSDDLDFFTNQNPDFQKEVEKIIKHLSAKFKLEISTLDQSFVRIFIVENEVSLKLEWINDVAYSFGEKKQCELFHRLDNWQNILSNKLSALSRNEPKDISDILFICKKFEFSWAEVIYQAKEKDMWVEEIEISRTIMNLPINSLEKVNWAISPNYEELENLKKAIAFDIISGKNNRTHAV
jgi:hypothetical protein